MSGLPRGWADATLGEVCHLQNGRAYKQEELLSSGKYPVLRVGNFFTSQKWYYSDLELEPTKYCHDGDLLYAWSASFGPRIWSGGKVIFHYHIWRVDLESRVSDRDFVFHWFNWDKENIKAAHGTGSTMIHVTKGDMEQRRISLPPLAEQKRIVAKLDALNAKSARARTELARIETLVSRYKQAVLSKAFSGELTSARFAEAEGEIRLSHPPHWKQTQLGEIADIKSGITLGKKRKPDEQLLELPYLRVANVQRGWLDLREIKTIEVTAKEAGALFLREGDVLMNEGGDRDKLGRGWVWDGQIHDCIHQNHVFRVRLASGTVPPRFLSYYANEFGQKHFFDEGKQTTNLASISKSKLSAMTVPVPPFEEATEIVHRIEAAFAKIDRLTKEAKRALDLVGRLDEAILAKAFRGELVPQDENDEPAEHLLARIHANREAAPKGKRRRGAKA